MPHLSQLVMAGQSSPRLAKVGEEHLGLVKTRLLSHCRLVLLPMQVLQLPSFQRAKEVVEVGLHHCQGWMLLH